MKDKTKPKYNAAQNVGWMVKIAWKVRKRVLFLCVAMAALEVAVQPGAAVRRAGNIKPRRAPCPRGRAAWHHRAVYPGAVPDHGTEGVFARRSCMFPRVDVRSSIVGMIGRKCNMTSFPNTLDAKFIKLQEKAHTVDPEQRLKRRTTSLGDPDRAAAERGRLSGVPRHPVPPELRCCWW